MDQNWNKQLLSFIADSPTAFHVVENLGKILENAGYTRVYEEKDWNLKVNSYTTEICQNYGFQQDIVTYLLSSIVYGLGTSTVVPKYASGNKTTASSSTKHTNKTNTISDLTDTINKDTDGIPRSVLTFFFH